jgi:3-oxoacyl-[acyl-carrier-protein] synthase II
LAFFDELLLSAARAGAVTTTEHFHVFDRRSRGTAFGEAGVALVLESPAAARSRGAKNKGALLAQASTFCRTDDGLAEALGRAADKALAASDTDGATLRLCSTGANGTRTVDQAEARALLQVLGSTAGQTAVTAIKANLGDTLDSAGLLQTMVAMAALSGSPAPAVVGLSEAMVPGLGYLTAATQVGPGRALVTATSQTGACSALVVCGDAGP